MDEFEEKKILSRFSDEELVLVYLAGFTSALEILYRRYLGFFYSAAFRYMKEKGLPDCVKEDLLDIAYDSLMTAIDSFDLKRDACLRNFWWTITLRGFGSFLKRYNTNKILLFDPSILEGDQSLFRDVQPAFSSVDKQRLLSRITDENNELFKEKELIFLELYLSGYDWPQIAEMMGCSKTTIYRLRKRVFDKLNMIFNRH